MKCGRERKGNTVQNKTEGRNDVKVKTCMEDLHCWVHSSSYNRILKWLNFTCKHAVVNGSVKKDHSNKFLLIKSLVPPV